MKNADIQLLIIQELEKTIEQEIKQLHCLNVIYTSALEFIENKKYDEFFDKLDEQQIVENALINTQQQISITADKYKNRVEIATLLSGSNSSLNLPHYLRKLSDDVLISRKLLKSCKLLNEKIKYHVKEVQTEIQQKMASFKNRRLIKTGYSSLNPYKTGLVIDC
ncbi:MAG: hypothetical protein A2Y15_04700 [Clostridiales bacterium GWF2_36_10]|nr:MAG: hypothetical protein A2Y15_04700 [Clostridiales bacterium GWF2_36_10]HAN20867.1 hypothetical protein [Clostridiales bacterium]